MPILSNIDLARALNRPTIEQEIAEATPGYYADVLAAVEDEVASYLGYNPCLSVHTGEQGIARLVRSGPYAGRYFIELKHRPLVPGPASAIFAALALDYALVAAIDTQVNYDFVQVEHGTGQIFSVAPGAVDALMGLTWGYAAMPGIQGVTYTASYAAGYATGVDDPVPLPGGSYDAIPLPTDIKQAALLLVRERLAADLALNANPGTPNAPYVTAQRFDEWQLTMAAGTTPTAPSMGYGTRLAWQAEQKLKSHRRLWVPSFI